MLLTAPGRVKAAFMLVQCAVGQDRGPPLAFRVDERGRPLMDTITARGALRPYLSQIVNVRLEPDAMPFGW